MPKSISGIIGSFTNFISSLVLWAVSPQLFICLNAGGQLQALLLQQFKQIKSKKTKQDNSQ